MKLKKAVIEIRYAERGLYLEAHFIDRDSRGIVRGSNVLPPQYHTFDAAKNYLQFQYEHVADQLDFKFAS